MSEAKIHGVVTILVTPFNDSGSVDPESLRRLVDFNIDCGVHGVGVAMGSEIFRLSEEERDLVTSTVVDQVGGRVPVVINTGAAGTDLAVQYSRRAQELGADAVMVLPPGPIPAAPEEIRSYFRAISNALEIPIVLQDAGFSPMPPTLMAQIAEECEQVEYSKVETPPTPSRIADTIRAAGPNLAVLGGAAGNFIIEELRRGSTGTMPGCSDPKSFVDLWNRFQAGDEDGANRVFYEEILPINRVSGFGLGGFYHVHKHILHRRGVIECAYVRGPTTPLDEISQRELDVVTERLLGQPANSA